MPLESITDKQKNIKDLSLEKEPRSELFFGLTEAEIEAANKYIKEADIGFALNIALLANAIHPGRINSTDIEKNKKYEDTAKGQMSLKEIFLPGSGRVIRKIRVYKALLNPNMTGLEMEELTFLENGLF